MWMRGVRKSYGTPGTDSYFTLSVPELDINAGQVYLIHGPSGCGKSTLLDMLGLISPLQEGEFYYRRTDGRVVNLTRAGEFTFSRIRRKDIGYILQSGGIFGFMTVRRNIELPMRLAYGKVNDELIDRLAAEDNLNIRSCLGKMPSQLSIGQRQRVAIARALALRPQIIIADEPTGAVDATRAEQIRDMLIANARTSGAATIIVTHDYSLFIKADIDVVYTFRPTEEGMELVQEMRR